METNNSRAGNNRGYISAIVVLLLFNIASLYLLLHEKNESTDINSQKVALQEDFRMLNDTLFVRSSEIEQLTQRNTELDKTIALKQEQIELQKAKIVDLLNKSKLSQAELSKLRDMVAAYKSSIAEMGERIAFLQKENETLHALNGQLSTDLTTERQTNTQLSEKNTQLSKKVEVGSLLPVPKLNVEAVRTRNNGKEIEVKRAKVAANLKISFETGENKVLDPGPLSVYVRIINPRGETIAVEDQGSGVLQTANTAEPVLYTKKADFDYDQANKKIVVYWGKHIQEPGVYKVELYQAGYIIGQGEVKLG
ncbi:MAG: hypothetical protein KIS94_00350 [Chitinophagales bacterium]|nr:hypothetical protein [Chitinophagales bacterium]